MDKCPKNNQNHPIPRNQIVKETVQLIDAKTQTKQKMNHLIMIVNDCYKTTPTTNYRL